MPPFPPVSGHAVVAAPVVASRLLLPRADAEVAAEVDRVGAGREQADRGGGEQGGFDSHR